VGDHQLDLGLVRLCAITPSNHRDTMVTINTKFALNTASKLLSRPTPATSFASARQLHTSAPTYKNPPLQGPVPTEQTEKVKEGGDGFLGVSRIPNISQVPFPKTKSS
jgi:hypothetical protein